MRRFGQAARFRGPGLQTLVDAPPGDAQVARLAKIVAEQRHEDLFDRLSVDLVEQAGDFGVQVGQCGTWVATGVTILGGEFSGVWFDRLDAIRRLY